MNAHLVLLALRRSVTPLFLIATCAILVLATQIEWAPPSEWSGATSIRAGAFARQGLWTIGALTLLPVLVHKAARTVPHWRVGEVDWLAKSPAKRGGILFSTWCGDALGAGLVIVLIAIAAEVAAHDTQPALRFVARLPAPNGALIDDDAKLSWSVAAPSARSGDRLQIGVVMIASQPAADVRIVTTRRARDGTVRRSQARQHVVAACTLEVEVPVGEGALEIELQRVGAGAIVALDGSGTAWLTPVGSASVISVDIALHAWLATIAWLALALGCGAWVSPVLAMFALIATALFTWIGASTILDACWPWGPLPDAIDMSSRAVSAGFPGMPRVIATVVCVVLGLTLARLNVATWRRDA